MVGGFYGRWSISNVVCYLRMVGCRCLNQYMVGSRWSVVGGWLVGGGSVLRPWETTYRQAQIHLFTYLSINLFIN